MADLPQYTGVTYDNAFSRNPEESMYDYMRRLASQRASGVLGGGGMLDTPAAETTSAPLGEVKQNCPPGYVLRNGACVRADEDAEEIPQISNEEYYKSMRDLYDNPEKAAQLRSLLPWGTGHLFLSDKQIEGAVRNMQNEMTGDQGFFNYIQGKDGKVIEGGIDRKWYQSRDPERYDGFKYDEGLDKYVPVGTGGGSLITGTNTLTDDIVKGMFGEYVGKPFDPSRYTNDPKVLAAYNTATPKAVSVNYLNPALNIGGTDQQVSRMLDMTGTLSQLNSGSISGGDSGYYTDSSGNSYTGGSDYGGWTGVTADGSGNDWDSFGGDDTY